MKVDVTTPDEFEAAADPAVEKAFVEVDEAVEPIEEPDPTAEAEDTEQPDRPIDDAVFSMADIEAARADAQAANERYLRLQAEWDNFRKRTAREREEEKARAAENLVTKLLPVVDDLERSVGAAGAVEPQSEYGQFVAGVGAVLDKLLDVLTRCGVEAVDPTGQPFDMNEHQALANVEDPSQFENTVYDVWQKGYRMGGRLIRPAMVRVTKGGPVRDQS